MAIQMSNRTFEECVERFNRVSELTKQNCVQIAQNRELIARNTGMIGAVIGQTLKHQEQISELKKTVAQLKEQTDANTQSRTEKANAEKVNTQNAKAAKAKAKASSKKKTKKRIEYVFSYDKPLCGEITGRTKHLVFVKITNDDENIDGVLFAYGKKNELLGRLTKGDGVLINGIHTKKNGQRIYRLYAMMGDTDAFTSFKPSNAGAKPGAKSGDGANSNGEDVLSKATYAPTRNRPQNRTQ